MGKKRLVNIIDKTMNYNKSILCPLGLAIFFSIRKS